MADSLHVSDETGPYDVALMMGRYPFDWELWDYVPAGAGWSKQKLGSGSGATRLRLPQAAHKDLAGHRLVWSVVLDDLDDQPHTTEFSVQLWGPSQKPSVKVTSTCLSFGFSESFSPI